MTESLKRLKGLDALTSLAADRERLLKQMLPAVELVGRYQDLIRPLTEAAKHYEESMQPLIEAGRRHEEAMRPLLEAVRQQQEAMRPFADAAKRQREMLRHFTDAFQANAPALALVGQMHIPQLQIAETFGKTMALNGVLDETNSFAALTERWREALGGSLTLTKLAATDAFADVQRLAESLRLSMPEFPAVDPGLFGSTLNGPLLDAFKRFRDHAQALVNDPDADIDDLETLVARAEAVNTVAPAELRSKVNGHLLMFFLWVLDKATEDPAKELIHNAIAALILMLTTVVPPAARPAPAAPVPRIERPAVPPSAADTMIAENWLADGLPAIIRRAGPDAERGMLAFLNDETRSPNTKQAYAAAVMKFMDWSEERGLELTGISGFVVRAYVKQMQREYAVASVKQHLAAIRLLFDQLVVAGALPLNPATSVRPSANVMQPQKGGVTVLQPGEAAGLLASIDLSDRSGIRDRALLGVMLATRARVSAIVAMDVKDYGAIDGQGWIRLRDRSGTRGVAVDGAVREALHGYLEAAGIGDDEASPLWRTMTKQRAFGDRRMSRVDVYRMIRRRAREAGIAAANCDTLRVSGVATALRQHDNDESDGDRG